MRDIQLATFEINFETWQEFKDKASQNHRSASSVLREFVDAYLQGDSHSRSVSDSDEDLVNLIQGMIRESCSDRIDAIENRVDANEKVLGQLGDKFVKILNVLKITRGA
ncbi:hypothetical protein Q2T42_25605 [Leptolyngbya boryana CZ1]|uniref:Uncharacterized protein n=1 Tax=Leptolyngbya boryana CZ1 TaxID=3060204 RepID=A0AA96WTA9_LEPBY|nr:MULTISPECIES: hypothetical protein [Leptolyngbya]MBD1856442.1 hypothetical protein [Leptolyngbya sp. FACHB-1624]WNZ45167.1 hypothetical protein Q2T42_25605 [Leptolyngbya boryana CZ1]